jgi:hypothetical protein
MSSLRKIQTTSLAERIPRRIPGRDAGHAEKVKGPASGAAEKVKELALRIAARPQRERAKRRRKRGAAVAAAGVATGAGAYLISSERRSRIIDRVKGVSGRAEHESAPASGPNGEVPEYAGAAEGPTVDTKA